MPENSNIDISPREKHKWVPTQCMGSAAIETEGNESSFKAGGGGGQWKQVSSGQRTAELLGQCTGRCGTGTEVTLSGMWK